MQPGKPPRLRAGICPMLALLALGGLAPASATQAAVSRAGDGVLSPRLAALAEPSVRSAPPAEQAEALSLAAEGPGSLLREGNRVLVEVRFDHGAVAGVDDLRQAGAEIVNVSRRYQAVTVAAKPSELGALAGVRGITTADAVLEPITASTCPAGAVVSEGAQQLHAAEARSIFDVDGEGVAVGILSDSFDQATKAADQSGPVATHEAEDVASGDLPGTGNTCAGESTPVDTALDDYAPGPESPVPADEGRAMAQIVHDLAPRAKLAFATAFTGEAAFAENIETLARPTGEGGAGARVIADDVSYFEEPFFQEGPIGNAIKNVTERGVTYFSSAGNNNLINGGRNIASWEAPAFRDSSCPAGLPSYANHCMDFDPGPGVDPTFSITIAPKRTLTVDLQWAQPWNGVTTDLDAYLLSGGAVVAPKNGKEVHNVASSQRPVEILGVTNNSSSAETLQLAINRCDLVCDPIDGGDTGSPALKVAFLENGAGVTSTEYESSSEGDVVGPTIFGHNGAADAITVGAMKFDALNAPESYSSRGPVTHYFGPVGTATAEPLDTPQVLSKPDLTASDCGVTTFFAFESAGNWRFCGTSAAAPHAAGVAALMLQRDHSATPSQIRSALTESARPVGAFGPDAVGAGLVDAVGALERVPDTRGSGSIIVIPPAEPQSPPDAAQPKPAPATFFRRRPPKVISTPGRSVTAKVVFGSDQAGVTFLCKVDRERFHTCPARFVRRYSLGRHVLRVKAGNPTGEVDATPAVYRFLVKQASR